MTNRNLPAIIYPNQFEITRIIYVVSKILYIVICISAMNNVSKVSDMILLSEEINKSILQINAFFPKTIDKYNLNAH